MAWGLSKILSKTWCLEVLEEAMAKHGKPEIINSDQGSQYTSGAWHAFMEHSGIKNFNGWKGTSTRQCLDRRILAVTKTR